MKYKRFGVRTMKRRVKKNVGNRKKRSECNEINGMAEEKD